MSEAIDESLKPVVKLARSRRRWFRCISVSEGMVVVLCFAAVVVVADIWLSFDSSVRWGAWVLLAGCAFVWCVDAGVRARDRYTEDEAAISMEAAAPEIGQKVRTALDISRKGTDASADKWGFRKRLLVETGELIARYNWSRLVPRSRAVQWMALVGVVVAGIFLACLVSPDFRLGLKRLMFPGMGATYTRIAWEEVPEWFDQTGPVEVSVRVSGRVEEPVLFCRIDKEWAPVELIEGETGIWTGSLSGYRGDLEVYAEAGDGETDVRLIPYEPVPELVEATVRLRFPDYLELAEEQRSGGDVRAVEGTEVSWSFVFNTLPKEVVWSVPHGGEAERLEVREEVVTSALVLEEGAVYPTLRVVDRLGRPVEEWRFRAEGLKDELPEVEILEPAEDRGATRVTEIPVRIRVKDDFGLGEVGVVLETNGEKKWLLERVIDGNGVHQINDMVVAMLEEVPLELYDSVRVYAYGLDRKPRGGPRGLSPLRSIDIHQFERRWFDGGVGVPVDAELIKKLGQIISEQREVVSTLFVVTADTFGTLGAELVGTCREQSGKEAGLGNDLDVLIESFEKCGCVPEEDVDMLRIAAEQMREAADALSIPEAERGLESADAALENMLALRKKMFFIIMKGAGKPCEIPPTEKLPRHLSEIAEDYRELAAEEGDVRRQIEAGDGNHTATDPKVLKRQQTVATAKAGELYAELLSHPQKTVGVLTLADEAESEMVEAETDVVEDRFQDAVPELETAEVRLLEVADFLEILEEQILSEAMEEMAEKMAKIAAKMEMEYTDLGGIGEGDLPQEMSLAGEESSAGEAEEGEAKAEGDSKEAAEGEDGQSTGEGEIAEAGESGQGGETGKDGEDGDEGMEGNAGNEGESGLAESGDSGEQGENGEQGKAGKAGESDLAKGQGEKGNDGSSGQAGEEGEGGQQGDSGKGGLAETEGESDSEEQANGGGRNGKSGMGGEGEEGEGGKEGMSGFAGRGGKNGPGMRDREDGERDDESEADTGEGKGNKKGGEMASASENNEGGSESGKGEPDGTRKSGRDARSQALQETLSEAARSLRLADQMMAALAERGTFDTEGDSSENGKGDSDRGAERGKPGKESDSAAVGKLRKALALQQLAERVLSEAGRPGEGHGNGKSYAEEASGDQPAASPGQEGVGAPELVQEIREASEKIQDLAVQFAANRSTQLAEVKADLKEMKQDSLDAMASEQPGQQIGAAEDKQRNPEREQGDGTSLAPFLDKVERLHDAKLGAWGREMTGSSDHRKRLPLIGKMESRIDELASELPRRSEAKSGDRGIPEESRRDVEDYFRDLSDDFGGESWTTQ